MVKRRMSNPLALAVLALLYERPMHPYEMATTLRERHKEDSIKLNFGSLYTVVDSLVRHALIEARETVREGRRPERTIYAITQAGHVELVDWLSDLISTPVKEYTQFEAALSLMPCLPPEDVVKLLGERAGRLDIEIRHMAAMREMAEEFPLPRLFWVEAEYRQLLRRAELDWIRELARQIADGSFDGIDMWRRFHADPGVTAADAEAEIRSLAEKRATARKARA